MSERKHLRITFICGAERPSGGQRVIAIYANELSRRGHDVTVVLPSHGFPTLWEHARHLTKNRWLHYSKRVQTNSFFTKTTFTVRRLNHPGPVTDRDVPDADVVIASWWEVAEWVAALSSSKGAKVHFIQGHETYDYLPRARVEAIYRLSLHKIVISQWLKRVVGTLYGDHTIDLVPNSVDRAQFFAPIRRKQPVSSVGLLYSTSHTKGTDAALSALQLVRLKIPNLRILSFGFFRPSNKIPLLTGTEYFCSPPQEQIRSIYSHCDAWITASRQEGFNLTALEAMACRAPVTATATGWPADAVVTGFNGVLVDVEDVRALAEGIEWTLSRTDAEWQRLSANAYATASSGSWEESTLLLEQALVHACERAKRGELLVSRS